MCVLVFVFVCLCAAIVCYVPRAVAVKLMSLVLCFVSFLVFVFVCAVLVGLIFRFLNTCTFLMLVFCLVFRVLALDFLFVYWYFRCCSSFCFC